MNEFLKILGIVLLFIGAFVFCREYEKRIKTKNEVSEAFLSLLVHIRRQIDCYLTPVLKLADGFKSDALTKCGFLELAKREGVSKAFAYTKEQLPIYSSVKKELYDFFSGLGREYKDGTLKLLESSISSLNDIIKKEKEESEKDLKVARILSVAVTIGIVILLL